MYMDGERAFLWKRKNRLGSEAKLELLCQWMALTNLLFSYCTTQIHHINTFSAHLNRPTIVEAIGESHELTAVFVSALIDACTICRQICVCKTFFDSTILVFCCGSQQMLFALVFVRMQRASRFCCFDHVRAIC